MAKVLDLQPTKTYASRENAIKAVEKKMFGDSLYYLILTHTDGRFFPVFIGEKAILAGVHFHFHVVN